MKRHKIIILIFLLLIVVIGAGITFFYKGWGLFSCDNKEQEDNKIYIDSFDYNISKDEQNDSQKLAYNLAFDIDFSINEGSSIKDLIVLVETMKMLDYNDFHLTIDYCNTENVSLASSTDYRSYVKLNYKVDTTTVKVTAIVKILTNYLIDDINNFLKIKCYSTQKHEIVDTNQLLDSGFLNIHYIDNSNIFFVYDEFSESYKVKTVTTQSEFFEIPEIYNGHPVKAIATKAFRDCENIKNIVIPDSVTSVEKDAFTGCPYIERAVIPAIAAIYLPKNNLKEVVITSGTDIIENSFENGIALESIIVADSILNVDYNAFAGCTNIKKATIPTSVITALPKENLEEVVITSGSEISASAFYKCSNLTSITLPNGLVSIGEHAFSNCSNLIQFTIPDGVANIGAFAFTECGMLESITIPDSITNMGESVFSNCSSLKNVYYEGNIEDWCNGYVTGSSFFSSSNSNHFYLKNNATEWEEVTSITIPNTITNIKESLFYGFNNVLSIVLPNSIESIETFAFYDCSNLTSMIIPKSVTSIDADAFQSCYRLVEVYNFSSLNITTGSENNGKLGYYAKVVHTKDEPSSIFKTEDGFLFYKDSLGKFSLISYEGMETDIILPSSIDGTSYRIHDYAFDRKDKLTEITIPTDITSFGKNVFGGCKKLMSITLPFVGASMHATTNTHFGYIFGASSSSDHSKYVPESLKEVIILGGEYFSNEAFLDCNSIESITIPKSIKGLGKRVFYNCSSLKNVYYEGSIEDWCNLSFTDKAHANPMYYASHFYQKNSNNEWEEVTSIEIPESITTIGEFQFLGFNNMTSIKLPKSIKSIKKSAFNRCSSLESIMIPNTVTSIEEYAFSKCENLISIVLPGNVGNIKDYTFYGCENLKEVYYTGSSTNWKNITKGVYGNEALANATIYYYSEIEPTEEDNCWHYVDGIATKW